MSRGRRDDGETASERRKRVNHVADFVTLPGSFQERHLGKKRRRHGSHSGPRAGPAAAERVRGPAWCTGSGERGEDEDKGDLDGPTAGGPDGQELPGNPPFDSQSTLFLDWL